VNICGIELMDRDARGCAVSLIGAPSAFKRGATSNAAPGALDMSGVSGGGIRVPPPPPSLPPPSEEQPAVNRIMVKNRVKTPAKESMATLNFFITHSIFLKLQAVKKIALAAFSPALLRA
jgi:hypothetical protein